MIKPCPAFFPAVSNSGFMRLMLDTAVESTVLIASPTVLEWAVMDASMVRIISDVDVRMAGTFPSTMFASDWTTVSMAPFVTGRLERTAPLTVDSILDTALLTVSPQL